MPSFSDILLGVRVKILEDFPLNMQERYYRLYLFALNRALQKVSPSNVTKEVALELLKDITRQSARYAKATELDTKRQILAIIRRTTRGHQDALQVAIANAGVGVSASFTGVSREAFENLFLRRSMGLTASYKSLSVEQVKSTGRTIERAVESMVLDGDSWQRATQRIIDGLTQGDPELNRMAKSMARKSRGLGNWLESATDEASIESIKAARKIAYDARRIARTEPAHAYHEADRTMSERSPVVAGMQWNLSPKHPVPDICDVYAKHNFHGMGAGVYPPAYLPPLPHPHDLCFMTHKLREPGAWQRPKKVPTEPQEITAAMIATYMPKGTDNAISRTMGQVNSTAVNLIEINS